MTSAYEHFSAKLEHETDASDVYAAQKASQRFTIVDVRGASAWQQGRITGAIHIPRQEIAARAPAELDPAIPIVVYCWSPGCNAATKGALELTRLGYRVKEMIGGYEYWVRQGQPTENDQGPLPRTFDPLVMVVRPT